MEEERLTFSLFCSGPPATARNRESEEKDIKEGRRSGTEEEGGVETLMKGMRKKRNRGRR